MTKKEAEMEKLSHEEKMSSLFITMVQQYQMQGWVSLGKLKNPATDKIERNLELAKLTIDILDMLKEKTLGNLTGEEERMLEQVLADLKLNFVDEYEKERKEKQAKKDERTGATPPQSETGERETGDASG